MDQSDLRAPLGLWRDCRDSLVVYNRLSIFHVIERSRLVDRVTDLDLQKVGPFTRRIRQGVVDDSRDALIMDDRVLREEAIALAPHELQEREMAARRWHPSDRRNRVGWNLQRIGLATGLVVVEQHSDIAGCITG